MENEKLVSNGNKGGQVSDAFIRYGIFRNLMARVPEHEFVIDEDRCFGCAACVAFCPVNALELKEHLAIVTEPQCTHCNHCIPLCPVHALSIIRVVT